MKVKPNNMTSRPQPRYKVMCVSKLVALDLFSYISSFKTFEWRVPEKVKEASHDVQTMFIRGFADSEGSVKNRHRNREITLSSGNPSGLSQIKDLLKNININSYILKRPNNVVNLYISDYNSLKIFSDVVGFTIKRKQNKLEAGLSRYKRKGIRKYSLGMKQLALDMLKNGYNYQEIGKILNTSYANVHDWEKANRNPDYYQERYQRWKANQQMTNFLP